jgi:hypothetical protein
MMKFIATAAPVWARALRRLRLLGEINDLAAERIEIWPAEMTMGLPAIGLAGEFDRVKNVRPYTTLAEQAAAMTGHHTHHSATVGYRLRNALIADGTLYVGSRYEAIAKMRRRPFVFGRFREYETAQLCADVGSDLFFGFLRKSKASSRSINQTACGSTKRVIARSSPWRQIYLTWR